MTVQGIRRKPKNARKRIRKQQDTQNKTEAQRLQEDLFGLDVGELQRHWHPMFGIKFAWGGAQVQRDGLFMAEPIALSVSQG